MLPISVAMLYGPPQELACTLHGTRTVREYRLNIDESPKSKAQKQTEFDTDFMGISGCKSQSVVGARGREETWPNR